MLEKLSTVNNYGIKATSQIKAFTSKVYLWMTSMLLLTTGFALGGHGLNIDRWFYAHRTWFLVFLFAELGLIAAFSFLREKLTFPKGAALVGAYTALNGLTLSTLFIEYNFSSMVVALLVSASVFGMATLYGFLGKDLLRFGHWLFVGLIGLLFAMIANILIASTVMGYVISAIAVVIFTVLAAYDAQMVRTTALSSPTNISALNCALEIYLDFLNIFLHILRLFGVKVKD
jgi:hypothetical protein